MGRKKSRTPAAVIPALPLRAIAPEPQKAERLRELNYILIKQCAEQRERVAALTARIDELTADTTILAAAERDVARIAFAEPLRAAAGQIPSLQCELDALAASLAAARARAEAEAEAREEVGKRLEAACVEKNRFLELLDAREAELVSVSEKAALLEKTVASFEAEISRLNGERGELGRKLERTEEAACLLRVEKAEVEADLEGLKNQAESCRTEMEEKVATKVREMEVLGAEKAAVDEKIASLEVQHSEAVVKNQQLEAEAELKKAELDSLKRAEEKLQSVLTGMWEKHAMASAETERLQMELGALSNAKEAAMAAFEAEKADLLNELGNVKGKVEVITKEKESAESKAHKEEAEADELRAELEKLHISMSELQQFCDELDAKHSRLQDEKVSVDKALNAEKAKAGMLRSRIEELKNSNLEKDGEIAELKRTLDDKGGKIDDLNKELELLQRAMAEAQRRGRQAGMWTSLYATVSAMLAAVSFIYAVWSR